MTYKHNHTHTPATVLLLLLPRIQLLYLFSQLLNMSIGRIVTALFIRKVSIKELRLMPVQYTRK